MTLKEAVGVNSNFTDKVTGEEVDHKELYTRAINVLGGLEVVIPCIPFTLEAIKRSLPQDKYLNNLSLRTWDKAVEYFLRNLCRTKRINISASEGVCILKEAARQWANK